MSLFAAALVVHVLAAILGVGPVAFMALLGSRAVPAPDLARERRDLLGAASRWVSVALALMLVSGLLLGAVTGLHETRWYRSSVLLLLVVGALNGFARNKLRRADPADPTPSIRFAARVSWWMCALVGVITLLMTLQPA